MSGASPDGAESGVHLTETSAACCINCCTDAPPAALMGTIAITITTTRCAPLRPCCDCASTRHTNRPVPFLLTGRALSARACEGLLHALRLKPNFLLLPLLC